MLISSNVKGLERLKRDMRRRVSALNDMTEFYRTIGRHMCDETVKDRFDKQRSPDGTPWASWSESYKKHLARQLGGRKGKRSGKRGKLGNKILNDTGRLRNSFHFYAYRDRAVIGTNVVYARAHQFGVPKRNLPARPFLGINKSDKKWIVDALGKYIFNRNFGSVE